MAKLAKMQQTQHWPYTSAIRYMRHIRLPAGWLQNYVNTIQTPNTSENRYIICYNLRIFPTIVSVWNRQKIRIFNLGRKNKILILKKSVSWLRPCSNILCIFRRSLSSGLWRPGDDNKLRPQSYRHSAWAHRMDALNRSCVVHITYIHTLFEQLPD